MPQLPEHGKKKKSKLDQHRSRCHGGFDCRDCSTTFNSPAEYKGHTSCTSEAEKYQKSLYERPRTAELAPKNNYPPQPASEPYPGGGSGWGRGNFRGGRARFRGRRGGQGQASSGGTGANDTPLGTRNHGPPITQPTAVPAKEILQPPVVEPSSNDSCKGKKRKSIETKDTILPNGDVPSNKRPKIDVRHVEEPASGTSQCKRKVKVAMSTDAMEMTERQGGEEEEVFTDDNENEPGHTSKKETSEDKKEKKRRKNSPKHMSKKDKKRKKEAVPSVVVKSKKKRKKGVIEFNIQITIGYP